MNDKRAELAAADKIYTLLLSLKEEISRLSLQIKAIKAELKGVKGNG